MNSTYLMSLKFLHQYSRTIVNDINFLYLICNQILISKFQEKKNTKYLNTKCYVIIGIVDYHKIVAYKI